MRYNTLLIDAFKVLYGAKRNNHFLKEFCGIRSREVGSTSRACFFTHITKIQFNNYCFIKYSLRDGYQATKAVVEVPCLFTKLVDFLGLCRLGDFRN